MNHQLLSSRVASGISAFNEYFNGTSWVSRINIDELQVWDPHKCPLYMVFGGYIDGKEALNLGSLERLTQNFGFCGSFEYTDQELTDEWKSQLSKLCEDLRADHLASLILGESELSSSFPPHLELDSNGQA